MHFELYTAGFINIKPHIILLLHTALPQCVYYIRTVNKLKKFSDDDVCAVINRGVFARAPNIIISGRQRLKKKGKKPFQSFSSPWSTARIATARSVYCSFSSGFRGERFTGKNFSTSSTLYVILYYYYGLRLRSADSTDEITVGRLFIVLAFIILTTHAHSCISSGSNPY